jgi:hypothetical protein
MEHPQMRGPVLAAGVHIWDAQSSLRNQRRVFPLKSLLLDPTYTLEGLFQ